MICEPQAHIKSLGGSQPPPIKGLTRFLQFLSVRIEGVLMRFAKMTNQT